MLNVTRQTFVARSLSSRRNYYLVVVLTKHGNCIESTKSDVSSPCKAFSAFYDWAIVVVIVGGGKQWHINEQKT